MPRKHKNPAAAANEQAAPPPVVPPSGDVDPEDEGGGRIVSLSESKGFLDSESKNIAEVAMRQVARRRAGEKEVKLDADMEIRFWQAKELYPRSNVIFRQISPHESDNIPPRRMDFFNNFGEAVAYVRDMHWNGDASVYKWAVKDDGHPGWTVGKMKFDEDLDWLRKKANGGTLPQENPMNQPPGPPNGGYPPQGYPQQQYPQQGYQQPQQQAAPPGYPIGTVINGHQWSGSAWLPLPPQQANVQPPPPPQPPPPTQQQPQYQPPPPDNALTMQLVGQLSEANARAARAEETNRSNELRFAEMERRFLGGQPVQQPAPQQPQPVQQPQPQPVQQQPQYPIGAIVNNHQWNGQQWLLLPPQQMYQNPQQPAPAPAAPPDEIEGLERTVGRFKRVIGVAKSLAHDFAPPEDPEPPAPKVDPDDPFPVKIREVGPLNIVAVDGEWDRGLLTNFAFNIHKAKPFISDTLDRVEKIMGQRAKDVETVANVQSKARREKIDDTNAAAEALERLKRAQHDLNAPAPAQQVQQAPVQQPVYQQPPPPVYQPPPQPQVAMTIRVEDPPPAPEPKPESKVGWAGTPPDPEESPKASVETQGESVQETQP